MTIFSQYSEQKYVLYFFFSWWVNASKKSNSWLLNQTLNMAARHFPSFGSLYPPNSNLLTIQSEQCRFISPIRAIRSNTDRTDEDPLNYLMASLIRISDKTQTCHILKDRDNTWQNPTNRNVQHNAVWTESAYLGLYDGAGEIKTCFQTLSHDCITHLNTNNLYYNII